MLHQERTPFFSINSYLDQLSATFRSSRLMLGLSFGLGGLGVLGICVGIFFLFQSSGELNEASTQAFVPPVELHSPPPADSENRPEIMVEVSGAVKKPGVYVLPPNTRVSELIDQAEGFTASVDQEYVDQELRLTEKLTDGYKLFIPSRGKSASFSSSTAASSQQLGNKLNVNQATAEELNSLPGVGDKRVQTILDQRPFSSLEDFSQRTSITGKSLKEIEQLIVF